MVPGRITCCASISCSPPRNWPAAMKSCTPVTTIGMTVQGFEMQVASATMPTFITCASICPKPAMQACPAGALRDQDAGRTHERVDDVADPQRELLHSPIHASADDGLRQIHLGLGQRRFGAGLLRREQRGDPRFGRLLGGGRGIDRALAALDGNLQPLDVAHGDGAGVAPVELLLGLQFVHGLLVGAPGFLDLAFRRQDVGPRDHQAASTSAILRRAASAAASCVELSSLKIGAPCFDLAGHADIDLGDAPIGLRTGSERF